MNDPKIFGISLDDEKNDVKKEIPNEQKKS
jgi:hypothetical protein